jgi:hypothetical protein
MDVRPRVHWRRFDPVEDQRIIKLDATQAT